jgi:hypothetical protein
MNPVLRILAAAWLAATSLPAQAEATTLAALALESDHVVVARATHRTDPDASVVRIAFERVEDLKGTAPLQFSLSEPAGACCGQLLFTIDPGEQLVLFLDRMGPRLHLHGGSRAGVEATAAVVDHVRGLCSTTDPMLRAGLLADALAAEDARVRTDAALALASAPVLPQAAPALEAQIVQRLGEGPRALTPDMPALLRIGARMDLPTARRALLGAYLDAVQQDDARALRMWVASYPAGSVANDLATLDLEDDGRTARAARLLAELPADHALPVLQRLTRKPAGTGASHEIARALAVHGVRTATVLDEPVVPQRPRLQVVPAGRKP